MGQKVNPLSFRIGAGEGWKSRWFATGGEYKKLLFEDVKLRRALEKRLELAGLHDIEIERLPKSITVKLLVSRPGVVIGRGGSGIEDLKNFILEKLGYTRFEKNALRVEVEVEEIKNPELSARLVLNRVVAELERRFPHRRVVAKTMDRVMASGAKGIKIALSGRIGGAEISRAEQYHRGSVPLQSLRADIDYASGPVLLKRGYVGIKVWVNIGERGKDAGA